MVSLCPQQEKYLDGLLRMARGPFDSLQSALIIGPGGSGKRTVTRSAARALGYHFVEVPLADSAESVRRRLFGSLEEAERAREGERPPGELGSLEPCLLYISCIEHVEDRLLQDIQRFVTTRRYCDGLGTWWTMSEDLWIVGGLKYPVADAKVGPTHWVITAFDCQLRIDAPSAEEDLRHIAGSIIRSVGCSSSLDSPVDELLGVVSNGPSNLHSLHDWMASASLAGSGSKYITVESLREAMEQDVRPALAQIDYQGASPTEEGFSRWLGQFPRDLQPIAIHLVRQVAERYYVSVRSFNQALEVLIRRSGVPPHSEVTFCKWQPEGKSAPWIAHALKNRASWKVLCDIDLMRPLDEASDLDRDGHYKFVVADDMVGSGRTLGSLCDRGNGPLDCLLRVFPNSSMHVLILAGFDGGLRYALTHLGAHGSRVKSVCAMRYTDEDRCFTPNSRILPEQKHRELLRDFCLSTSRRLLGSRRFRLGYEELGAITVFYQTVPNNSLSLLWYDRGQWSPLFPASGARASV